MRVYRSGHGPRALVVLVATASVVCVISLGLAALSGWRAGLVAAPVAALVAGLLLALPWLAAWTAPPGKGGSPGRAPRDPLTGLPGRTLLVDRANRALDRAAGGPRSVVVMVVDLDDFEEVNHGLGHEAGDRLLAALSERLEGLVETGGSSEETPRGTVVRLCGDEFGVLFENVEGHDAAVSAAQRIGDALRAPVTLDGGEVTVSASVGIAVGRPGPGRGGGAEDLLREADVAMHAAKRKGKARHRLFDLGAETTTSGHPLLEADMRRAVEEGEFRVHYQPIFDLRSGRLRGFEALVRWQHPVYGMIAPGEFVPLAEQTGLIVPIGRWVLEEACRRVRLWQKEYPAHPPLTLNANVSPNQFRRPNLAREVLGALEGAGLDPRHLELEITESTVVHDASTTAALRDMKGSGVRLALDDFGTGYSNLSYVKRLPLDALKIDRSYVGGLGRNAQDTAIVHATVAFAKALDLSVTAEGIENAEQLARLKDLGCEMGQGYHFTRPLPPDEAASFLSAHLRRSTTARPG